MAIGKEIGRKLSVSSLGFSKPVVQAMVIDNKSEKHFLARFIGAVTGLKPYKIKDGDRAGEVAYGLMGQFEATDRDGSVREGSVLYLPGYVNDAIVSIFSTDESILTIKIAFDVYAQYDEASATSYTFIVNDLLNNGSESISEVREVIKGLPLPGVIASLEDKSKK